MIKKAILLTLMQLFIGGHLFSQKIEFLDPNADYKSFFAPKPRTTLDKSSIQITYRFEILHDTLTLNKVKTNVMLLQIGAQNDKYFDLYALKSDEFMASEFEKGKTPNDIINEGMQIGKGTLKDEIYWNYPEKGQLTATGSILGSYLYEEDIPKIKWEMEAGADTVADYVCQKAVCHLFGRNYTAWYTLDIPVSKGPWKFSGLPGLILKVEDDQKQVSWTCIGLEKKEEDIYFTERDYIKTDKAKFLKSFNDYRRNPIAMYQSSGTITSSTSTKPRKTRAYNPIERE